MSKSRAGTTNKKTAEGVSDEYHKELLAVFQLHCAKETDTLSLHSLQLAMRTLGFDATLDDIFEIVNDTPSLSLHKGKGKKKNKVKSKRSKGKGIETSQTRKSSRASSERAGQKSKYVDSDEGEASGDDDDNDQDAYRDNNDDEENEYGDEGDEDDLWFTLQDFIALMKPSEEDHAQDEVSRVFQLFDTEGKGNIRLEDLRRVASELGIPMKEQELQEMIEEGDRDGDGGVTEQEFTRIMKKAGF
ncbi:hypothetical protein BGZ96_005062 [Linnemannia gamsii]|uniref:EF-hand domain-containing protein n=1 Tax=Linnemannia gamsii TaxID=64522 RepID=A0ABQ7K606_9FUNG|nr:hypothetical protein BGZ96_005062 [Linnemannia gamsii]